VNNLNATFSALADPTRRAILARLALGESTVGELARPFDVSLPAISRHLRVLETAALIVRERRGKHRVCRLTAQAMAGASQWLDFYSKFWNESFDRLDRHLKQTKHLKQNKGSSNASTKKR
jgi:DNA-binding transcriptional ArsR family regulator